MRSGCRCRCSTDDVGGGPHGLLLGTCGCITLAIKTVKKSRPSRLPQVLNLNLVANNQDILDLARRPCAAREI